MTDFRTEHDTLGEVRLPADAYYGPQTQRAVENFPISGRTLPPELIHALGLVKWSAAAVNRDLGLFSGIAAVSAAPRGQDARAPAPSLLLSDGHINALLAACREVADGKFDDHFPVDVFQTGSGTSSNMNANEVIAHRANELAGQEKGTGPIHPNDHVTSGKAPTTYSPRRFTSPPPWRSKRD
jgi:fumarate hydratase class II